VARLDGAFGLAGLAFDHEPLDGGLAGLIKTAQHEWPEVAFLECPLGLLWNLDLTFLQALDHFRFRNFCVHGVRRCEQRWREAFRFALKD
jgi:hypothetical protein